MSVSGISEILVDEWVTAPLEILDIISTYAEPFCITTFYDELDANIHNAAVFEYRKTTYIVYPTKHGIVLSSRNNDILIPATTTYEMLSSFSHEYGILIFRNRTTIKLVDIQNVSIQHVFHKPHDAFFAMLPPAIPDYIDEYNVYHAGQAAITLSRGLLACTLTINSLDDPTIYSKMCLADGATDSCALYDFTPIGSYPASGLMTVAPHSIADGWLTFYQQPNNSQTMFFALDDCLSTNYNISESLPTVVDCWPYVTISSARRVITYKFSNEKLYDKAYGKKPVSIKDPT